MGSKLTSALFTTLACRRADTNTQRSALGRTVQQNLYCETHSSAVLSVCFKKCKTQVASRQADGIGVIIDDRDVKRYMVTYSLCD